MEHTVKKNRINRIAMRITALVFLIVAIAHFLLLVFNEKSKNQTITIILCVGCLSYGLYLLRQTLKPQAYDITYVFGDKTLTLKLHRKELKLSYGEIRDLGYVIPNENIDYSIIQIYIGKEQYVIPFAGNSNVGKALYEMLQMKKKEAEDEMKGNRAYR